MDLTMRAVTHFSRRLITVAASLGLCCSVAWADETQETTSDPVRVGMVNTLFRDTPEPLIMAMMQPFGAMMESQTGLRGKLSAGGDANHLGQLLAEDKVQIAVFHGVEFAWARQKYADLQPLMIAINQDAHLRAFLVVREEAAVSGFPELKGKTLAFARRTREHCHLYLERRCLACGQDSSQFFGKITTPSNAEEALEDVLDNVVQATIVDNVAIDCFKRRKPSRFAQLKIVQESEVFPAAVVAYRTGALDAATLRAFREGMIKANKSALGRQLMMLWKLTGFEPVPNDYEQTLTEIVKAYPPPESSHK